jgi:hypothetical protein
MSRGKLVLAAAVLAMTFVSGCGLRDRPLLSRRERGCQPECPCPTYMNGYGMEAMPCSMPGGGCPCSTMPGAVMPGAVMPGGGVPEFMPQPMPGNLIPPGGNGGAPGSAAPKAADPSDGMSLRKTNGVPGTKTGTSQ